MDPRDDPAPGPRRSTVLALLAGSALAGVAVLAALGWGLDAPSDLGGPGDGRRLVAASTEAFTVWERNDDGTPVRWDPCTPIHVEVAPAGAPDVVTPAAFVQDVEVALATLRRATGLDLVLRGTTDERPSTARPPYHPERDIERWAPILIAWAAPGELGTPLRDVDRGVAIPVAVGPGGDRTYVSGQVVLNRDRDDLQPGNDDRATSWGATILHELAHVLGLGHVADPDQLMAVHPGEGPVAFGEGDRAGLAAIGAEAGCLEVPTPRVVEVADAPRTHGVPLDDPDR